MLPALVFPKLTCYISIFRLFVEKKLFKNDIALQIYCFCKRPNRWFSVRIISTRESAVEFYNADCLFFIAKLISRNTSKVNILIRFKVTY